MRDTDYDHWKTLIWKRKREDRLSFTFVFLWRFALDAFGSLIPRLWLYILYRMGDPNYSLYVASIIWCSGQRYFIRKLTVPTHHISSRIDYKYSLPEWIRASSTKCVWRADVSICLNGPKPFSQRIVTQTSIAVTKGLTSERPHISLLIRKKKLPFQTPICSGKDHRVRWMPRPECARSVSPSIDDKHMSLDFSRICRQNNWSVSVLSRFPKTISLGH